MKQYDCIFIPGGGLLPDGSLPLWTLARLNAAIEYKSQTHWIAFLSGGSVHKPPPLNKEGYPVFESRAAADYLIKQGLTPEKLLTEISSYDTIGNAYFSRLLFTDPGQFKDILVITSSFHMPRVEAAFKWIYNLMPKFADYKLEFLEVADVGLSPCGLKERIDREGKSLESMHNNIKKINTIIDFQNWLYSEHDAYSVQGQPDRASGDVLESY